MRERFCSAPVNYRRWRSIRRGKAKFHSFERLKVQGRKLKQRGGYSISKRARLLAHASVLKNFVPFPRCTEIEIASCECSSVRSRLLVIIYGVPSLPFIKTLITDVHTRACKELEYIHGENGSRCSTNFRRCTPFLAEYSDMVETFARSRHLFTRLHVSVTLVHLICLLRLLCSSSVLCSLGGTR